MDIAKVGVFNLCVWLLCFSVIGYPLTDATENEWKYFTTGIFAAIVVFMINNVIADLRQLKRLKKHE